MRLNADKLNSTVNESQYVTVDEDTDESGSDSDSEKIIGNGRILLGFRYEYVRDGLYMCACSVVTYYGLKTSLLD